MENKSSIEVEVKQVSNKQTSSFLKLNMKKETPAELPNNLKKESQTDSSSKKKNKSSKESQKAKQIGLNRPTYVTVGPNNRKYKLDTLYKMQKYQEALVQPQAYENGVFCNEGECGQLVEKSNLTFHKQFECWHTMSTCERCQKYQCPKKDLQMHRYVCQMLNYEDLAFMADDCASTSSSVPCTSSNLNLTQFNLTFKKVN